MSAPDNNKYLMEFAEGHDNECEGVTKKELLEILADELGYTLIKK